MRAYTLLTVIISLLIAGCGTVNTVMRDESVASRKLNMYGTYCKSIPRVYSGVSYDFCILHGAPNPLATTQAVYAIPAVFIDFVLSGVLDTIALPYTIYRQDVDGNIILKKD